MRSEGCGRAGGAATNPVVSQQTVGNDAVELRRRSCGGGVIKYVDVASVIITDVSQREVVLRALLEEHAIAHQVMTVIEFHDLVRYGVFLDRKSTRLNSSH